MERDALGESLPEFGHQRRRRCPMPRPDAPARAESLRVVLLESAPEREVEERPPLRST